MNIFFPKQLILSAGMLLCCLASADPSAPTQQKNPDLFDGFSNSLMQAPDVSPYGIITGQDLLPLAVGYGLLTKTPLTDNQQYNAAYVPPNPVPSGDLPAVTGNTPTQVILGSILRSAPKENEIAGYSKPISDLFNTMDEAAIKPVSSASSYNAVGNVSNSNAFSQVISQDFANPYDSKSLFAYVPENHSGPAAANSPSITNPGEVYISLVDGALTPIPQPSTPTDDFNMQLRRIAAIQTAGVNALQEIFNRSKPVLSDSDADNMKTTLQALGDKSITDSPNTKRAFEQIMTTHRLDPNNTWYTHIQEANPVELQRQQLYLEAEMLYELAQVRQEEEQNKMLLAISLLSQNYQNRLVLNMQSQLSPSTIKAMTASATSTLNH